MSCEHTTAFDNSSWVEPPPDAADVCEDCFELGEDVWAHLRKCLSCGHVACCDSSPHRHAAVHHKSTEHQVMRSIEPGEKWRWCYVDKRIV